MPSYVLKRKIIESTRQINATVVGSPTVDSNFVVSGFSTSNYLLTPSSINLNTVDTFEIVLRTQYNSGSLCQQNDKNPFTIALTPEMMLVRLSGNDEWSTVYDKHTTPELTVGKWYTIRASFDGTRYKFERAVENSEFTTLATLENSTKIISNLQPFVLGINDTKKTPYTGSIDLANSYINVNGQRWWSGVKTVQTTDTRNYTLRRKVSERVVNATVVGGPTITGDFTVWGFSTSNYLQLYNTFNPGSSTWEIFLHFQTGSIGAVQELLSRADNDYYGLKIGLAANGKFWYTLDNNKTSHLFEEQGVTTATANTQYWLKLSFDGSVYTALISTDNKNWTTDRTFTSSANIVDTTAGTYLGINKTIGRVFTGAFFLPDCYIKANNNTWWSGTRMAIVEKSYNLRRIMYRTVPNCVPVGATVDSNFIASGFNASNYLDVSQVLPAINSNIQVYIKCTVGNLALGQNGRNTIFATKAVSKPSFGVANTGQPAIYLTGWGLGPSKYTAGQTIWLRVGWDKSTYVLYSCLDQGYTVDDIATIPWVQEGAWGYTTNIFSNGGFILGRNIYTPGEYWGGSLDLKNTRIDVDGKIIYLGTKVEKY